MTRSITFSHFTESPLPLTTRNRKSLIKLFVASLLSLLSIFCFLRHHFLTQHLFFVNVMLPSSSPFHIRLAIYFPCGSAPSIIQFASRALNCICKVGLELFNIIYNERAVQGKDLLKYAIDD